MSSAVVPKPNPSSPALGKSGTLPSNGQLDHASRGPGRIWRPVALDDGFSEVATPPGTDSPRSGSPPSQNSPALSTSDPEGESDPQGTPRQAEMASSLGDDVISSGSRGSGDSNEASGDRPGLRGRMEGEFGQRLWSGQQKAGTHGTGVRERGDLMEEQMEVDVADKIGSYGASFASGSNVSRSSSSSSADTLPVTSPISYKSAPEERASILKWRREYERRKAAMDRMWNFDNFDHLDDSCQNLRKGEGEEPATSQAWMMTKQYGAPSQTCTHLPPSSHCNSGRPAASSYMGPAHLPATSLRIYPDPSPSRFLQGLPPSACHRAAPPFWPPVHPAQLDPDFRRRLRSEAEEELKRYITALMQEIRDAERARVEKARSAFTPIDRSWLAKQSGVERNPRPEAQFVHSMPGAEQRHRDVITPPSPFSRLPVSSDVTTSPLRPVTSPDAISHLRRNSSMYHTGLPWPGNHFAHAYCSPWFPTLDSRSQRMGPAMFDKRTHNFVPPHCSPPPPQTNPLPQAPLPHPPRYLCEACNKSYSTFGGLSKHKQFHCTVQVKKEFKCKFCGKGYNALGGLKMHIRTHTLPCKCKQCGKAFSRPWLLQGHIRTHTGERPFNCPQCSRAFADRSNLRAHLQTHSDVKKYACRTCSKTFSRMSLLNKHEDGNCPGRMR